MSSTIEQLKERGFNDGAAQWIEEQIANGNGTLEQYLFTALNLNYVAKKNAEHEGYTGQERQENPSVVVVTTRVRPNGSFSNYLAYGHIKPDGSFARVGYPKDVIKPTYGETWGKKGGNQYEYEVSFNVPARFPFWIVKVYNKSAVQNKSIEVLFAPGSGQ